MTSRSDDSRVVPLRVSLLRPSAKLPERATAGSTGLDLYACLDDENAIVVLGPDPILVPTGVALELPAGYDAQVRPRSGLTRRGVIVPLGTIDSDYRGEVMVTMYTVGTRGPYEVRTGDRIAQLVVVPLALVHLVSSVNLSETERGHGGHGSTGD
jgi:dUTP pyrophosphatase